MTLEDQVKHLMNCRDQIKELKKQEDLVRTNIIAWLKNHNQDGVVFKHDNKRVTLMVSSAPSRKYASAKEKEQRVGDILTCFSSHESSRDVNATTREILEGLKNMRLNGHVIRDTLKIRLQK